VSNKKATTGIAITETLLPGLIMLEIYKTAPKNQRQQSIVLPMGRKKVLKHIKKVSEDIRM
jgi:hypothetical protein